MKKMFNALALSIGLGASSASFAASYVWDFATASNFSQVISEASTFEIKAPVAGAARFTAAFDGSSVKFLRNFTTAGSYVYSFDNNFSGYTMSAKFTPTVSPVSEVLPLGMLLAGLAAVGFVALRRRSSESSVMA